MVFSSGMNGRGEAYINGSLKIAAEAFFDVEKAAVCPFT